MKVLVIGGSGMLGHKLVQILDRNFEVLTTIRGNTSNYSNFGIFGKSKVFENVDIENFESIEKVLKDVKPDAVINAVGVIKQLPSSKNVVKTLTVNSIFPHRLREVTSGLNARLINISTDCVFSGKKGNYNENDVADAEDVYGKSKFLGEINDENCLTIRTSIIGRELNTTHSLVEWFLSNKGQSVKGFKNAVFSGFTTEALAKVIENLLAKFPNLDGLYHVSNDPINKYDLLVLLQKAFNADIEIEAETDFKINRSLNSDKFRTLTGFRPIPWETMIAQMADDQTPYKK